MRSIIKCAGSALGILLLSITTLGIFASTSSPVRAERALEDSGDTAFKIFRNSDEGSSRRGRAAARNSDDDTPAPARRRTRVAAQQSDDDTPAPTRSRSKGRQVASLGGGEEFAAPRPSRSISGGGNITWAANAGCLNGSLRSAVAHVASNYGAVTVNSTCRSAGHNASVGGAPKSYHLSGDAVDLRVHGNISGAASYLASLGGGYKHYGGGLFHVDTGPRRPF